MIENKLDEALNFVSYNFEKKGHDYKPMLLHSFKVSKLLLDNNYYEDIIIAGALHNLLEDTDVQENEIEKKFGREVLEIIKSVSIKPDIDDYTKQAKVMYKNCIKKGYPALIVKCADLIDNIDYIKNVKDEENREILINKYRLFLKMTKKLIGEDKLYLILKEKYSRVIK